MFAKNLKYYRLQKGLTKAKLAAMCSLSPMAITNYESGERKPTIDVIRNLANALDIKVSDFLVSHNENLVITHNEFRKNVSLSKAEQEYIYASVEDYLSRMYDALEFLGGNPIPDAPELHTLRYTDDSEKDAQNLRKYLGLSESGAIDDLTGVLENLGILIVEVKIGTNDFSGINGTVNSRPYIAVKEGMSPERTRFTIAHELVHLMFVNDALEEKENESKTNAISGAFLLPEKDIIRELGYKRTAISKDMELVCKEYGVSMYMLVKRARITDIINDSVERNFYIVASSMGWRSNEPSRIMPEQSHLLEQLVCRAVNEDEISIQKGMELLHLSYDEMTEICYFPQIAESLVYEEA